MEDQSLLSQRLPRQGMNSRKSVRWSAVPVAPVFVYVSVMVRGAVGPKGRLTYAQ